MSSLSSAVFDGTCKTILRNGSNQKVGYWVDNGGRGLTPHIRTKDGRAAQLVSPNAVAVAHQTNLFDFPTIRVYGESGDLLFAKEVRYIPIFGDPSKWTWTGSKLEPTK